MSQDANVDEAWKAPYVSYETLTNFIDNKLGDSSTLPPRIDPPFLDTYAGSVRPLLLMALKSIGLIGDQNQVLDPLRRAVQSADSRKQVLRGWATQFYAAQVALAEGNATAQMLWESFSARGYNGSTLRKAVVFYLALSEDVGLPRSVHFKAPKQQVQAATARRKSPRGTGKTPPPTLQSGDASAGVLGAMTSGPGETKVVSLGDAGSVTIHVAVRWLDLDDNTFDKLRKAIKDIESLAASGPKELEPPKGVES